MLTFDNRGEPLRHHATYRTKHPSKYTRKILKEILRRPYFHYLGGGAHFTFSLENKRYVYPFIRKNACSSFAKFIRDLEVGSKYPPEKTIEVLTRKTAVRHQRQVNASDCNFFIFRNPADRLVSLFNDKFIQGSGDDSLIANFHMLTGMDYRDSTFHDFVHKYLARYLRPFSNRWLVDAHVIPQADHLWPIRYDCVISLDTLHSEACRLWRLELADRYFKTPLNATSSVRYDSFSLHTRVSQLIEEFARSGGVPGTHAYIDDAVDKTIRRLYAVDYEMQTHFMQVEDNSDR